MPLPIAAHRHLGDREGKAWFTFAQPHKFQSCSITELGKVGIELDYKLGERLEALSVPLRHVM